MKRIRFISLFGLIALLSSYLPSQINAQEALPKQQRQQQSPETMCDPTTYNPSNIKLTPHFLILVDPIITDAEGNVDIEGLTLADYTNTLEAVYAAETANWPEPPVIDIDRDPEWNGKQLVYIGLETNGYGRVVPNAVADDTNYGPFVGVVNQATGAMATCMLLTNDYSRFESDYNGTLKANAYLRAAIAHEFHHMIQLGMGDNDPFAHTLWFESTSMYMEEQVDTTINANHIYGYPIIETALADNENNRLDNKFRQWLMLQYAHEHYGGMAKIKNLWNGIAAGQSGLYSFVHSFASEAEFNEFYHRYAISLRFMKDCATVSRYCFQEGSAYQTRILDAGLEPLIDHERLLKRKFISVTLNDHYASKWITVPHTGQYKLAFKQTAGSGQFKVSLVTEVVTNQGDSLEVQPLTINQQGIGEINYVAPAGATQAALVVSNVAAPQLNQINEPNSVNESTFSLTIQGPIAFVIDDTASMADDLQEVKSIITEVIDTPSTPLNVSEYLLTTFKDDVNYRGSFNAQDFKAQIAALEAASGGDCPENYLGAVRETAQHTTNADLHIYTDAGFFGTYREHREVYKLLNQRGIRPIVYFQNDCEPLGSRAAADSTQADQQPANNQRSLAPIIAGQQIMGRAEMQSLSEQTGGLFLPIRPYELAAATRLALTTSQFQIAADYVNRPINGPTTRSFPIDSSVSMVQVLNTTTQGNSSFTLKNPANQAITSDQANITELSNIQAYSIENPLPGTWSTQLDGDGTAVTNVWVQSPLQLVVNQPTILTYEQTNTLNFEVVGKVLSPTFELQHADGSLAAVIQAYDDGLHGDGVARDRRFTAQYYMASDEPVWLVLNGWNSAHEPIRRIGLQPFSAIKPISIDLPRNPITTEEGKTLAIPVNLSQIETTPITVSYSVHEATATINSDFQAVSGTLRFEPGFSNQIIIIPIIDDQVLEAAETFSVQISQPTTGTIRTAAVSVTIQASDRIDLPTQPILTNEGRSVLVPVTRTETTQPITLSYTTQAGTAQAGSDFVAQTGTISFFEGVASQHIAIPILDDNLAEAAESFTLHLTNSNQIQAGTSQTTITIQPNDQVNIKADSYTVSEGQPALVQIELNAPATKPVSVTYSVTAGSALEGEDYYHSIAPVVIEPGQTTATLYFYIPDDNQYEADETFSISLTGVQNAQVGATITSNVTISKNDELALSPYPRLYLDEWQQLVELPLTLAQPRAVTVTVDYRTLAYNGTNAATPLLDYTPISGTLTFPPYTTVQTLTLPLIDDRWAEPDERLFIRLENPINTTAVASTEIVILTNDTIELGNTTTSINEQATIQIPIGLSMNAPASQPITLTYQTIDGTALAGQDYIHQTGVITMPPLSYERVVYLDIPIIDDNELESAETFNIVIANPSHAELGAKRNLTITIKANDVPIPTATPLPANSVLFVTGSPASANDAAVIDRLEQQLGLNVITRDHNSVTAADASNGIKLVLVSSSVASTKIGSMFRDTPIPVLVWENAIFDDMQMTGSTNGTHFGVTAAGTQLTITNASHDLAAGLNGTISVYTSAQTMSYGGNLPTSAINIAYAAGNSTKRVIWGYESGTSMVGLTAPARRVGIFFGDLNTNQLTNQGWQLFDAAVTWAMTAPTAPNPTATTVIASPTATSSLPTATTVIASPTATSSLPTATPAGGTILFVAGSTSLNPSDTVIKSLLEARGYSVLVKKDSDAQSSDANGKKLIVVSSTVTSGNVTTKFLHADVPVLVWDMALFDDMKLTGATVGQDQGTTENVTTGTIVNSSHPLAGGLSGSVTLTSNGQALTFGEPNSNAVVVARAGGSNRSVLFGYEACALLKDNLSPAPARRVGLFLNDNTAIVLEPSGTTLVNAAITWALGGYPCINGATATPSNPASSTATSVPPTSTTTPPSTPVVTTTPSAKTALFVVNNANSLNSGDAAVKTRLETLGYSVTPISAGLATSSDSNGKTLVLISSSVSATNVNTKFKAVTVPVIIWEYALYDDMAMTNTTSGSDYGYTSGSSIFISNATHALAGGLSGTVNIYSNAVNIPFGVPNGNAITIGSASNASTNKPYFAYERNAAMLGGFSVNARRVGLFWIDTASPTNDAWTLFDAAVTWASMP
ncbi:Calx-beta domain-containing protein [Herpetosiphon giganteus]|uniref:Calx-beta domain-containing protein n=1 Tax=Herpetosiphon giganteus TaxID=2029754 RepID=UPI00195B2E17|nr:Calx-beta domain-containing protein [Herpetosiphon giganteus]MBM7844618.1 hypothetical protein [Herpetosiphon giganteus]